MGDTIKYSANLLGHLKKYESQFIGLQKLSVELIELSYFNIPLDNTKAINFGEDNKALEIKLTFHQSFDPKGNPYSSPSPFEVYEELRFTLDKAVKEYLLRLGKPI